MKNHTILFILIFSIFTLISCTTHRYIYSASPADSPYFTKKGQSELSGYYSVSGNVLPKGYAHGFDLHGAYAISDHWALTAGYFNRKEKDIDHNYNTPSDSSVVVVGYKRNLFGIGGGYFIPLNPRKTITFNLYGGMDFGKFSINENDQSNGISDERFHDSKITKWFIQPSINFMPGRYFHASFISKNSFVHYGGITTSYTTDELAHYSLNKIANKTIHFSEPALDIQLGFPNIPWLKLDMMWSFATSNDYDETQLDIRSPNFSIGLSMDFSQMSKK